jgi:hypothetical protein
LGYGFMMCAGKYLTKFKGFQENEYLAGYFSQAALVAYGKKFKRLSQ